MLVNDTARNVSIALKWTAPGDDLDEGTGITLTTNLKKLSRQRFAIYSHCSLIQTYIYAVSYYEIKYSDVLSDIINSNFDEESPIRKSRSIITEDNLVAGSLLPNEAGALQMATFQLIDFKREKTYYLSLRAVDKADKAGQVSNLVVFYIPDKSTLVMTKKTEKENSEVSTEKGTHIYMKNSKQSSYHHISAVLFSSFAAILIICCCVTLLMAIVKHKDAYRSYKDVPV